MKIAVMLTALMLSAFAFTILSSGGSITNVSAVAPLGEGDDDDDDDDDFDCRDADDNYEDDWGSDDEEGDGQDEDGGEIGFGSVGQPEESPRDWDGNDDQIEVDDCEYPPHEAPADYGSCDDPPGYPGAYFYYDTNYEGQCFRISGDTWFFFNDNDQASSIMLVGISTIVVCEHSDYQGVCVGLEESIPDLDAIGRNNDLSSAYFDGPAPMPTPPTDIVVAVQGDADCDGSVTSLDAVQLLRQIVAIDAADDSCTTADANCSGWLDPADVRQILKIVAGLATPC